MTTYEDVHAQYLYWLNKPTREVPDGSNHVAGITDWYGIDASWCAMTVSRCFYDAGMPLAFSSPKGFAWVSAGFDAMRAKGWCDSPRNARPGDLVAFEWGSTPGGYDHIGWVEEVRPDGVITIEGNVGNRVQRQWRPWTSGIAEIAHPPYQQAPVPVPPPTPAPAPTPTPKKAKMLSLVTDTDGRLVEFRASAYGITHRWQTQAGGTWSAWAPLTGVGKYPGAFDSVSAAVNRDGRLEVIAWHSAFGVPFRAWQIADGGAWSGWAAA